MNITTRCPNCFQEVSKEDSFCIYCGCDLDPSGIPSGSSGSTRTVGREEREIRKEDIKAKPDGSERTTRICKNGHNVDDPDLDYCPECGLPLESLIRKVRSHWSCACGAKNGENLSVCRGCGRPRGWEPEPVANEMIPSGMRLPKPEDLRKKK